MDNKYNSNILDVDPVTPVLIPATLLSPLVPPSLCPEELVSNTDVRKPAKFKVNMAFLVVFTASLNVGGICIGHILAATNQTNNVFMAKFPTYAAQPTLYSSLTGSAGVFGMAVGAITGGKLLSIGRRNAYLMSTFIGIVGVALTVIE